MTQGVVAKITAKDWEDPESGDVTKLYSFKLEEGEWYRTGAENPSKYGIREGAFVTFSLNPKGKPILKTVKITEGSAPARSPAPRAASTTKDDYWKQKEDNDKAKDARYQSVDIPRMTFCGAQDTAVRVVELALAQGAITLGTKKNAQLDILLGAIQQVATTLFRDRMNSPSLMAGGTVASVASTDDDDDESHTEGMGADDED